MKYKFEIKVFNSDEMFFKDNKEYFERTKDLIVDIKIFDDEESKNNLEKYWNMLYGQYEGMNYCIIDLLENKLFVSGVFDANDIDVIEDYK